MTKGKIFIILLILMLGFFLKIHNYDVYPQRGASSDEYTYSFLGISLLTKGIPISWSAFQSYSNLKHLTIDNLYFPIVYPYFDHPPLNGIVVGTWALLFGQDSFEKIKLSTVRLIPIILSTVSAFLIILIANRLYSFKISVWAGLIYSTTAIYVVSNRVVFAESLLTAFVLFSTYLFIKFKNKINIKKSVVFGVLCGLAFWTKEVGIFLFLSTTYLFVSDKIKYRFISIMLLTSIFIFFLYPLYGLYYDWELFLKIVGSQAERDIGVKTILYLISAPIIVNKVYMDGWYFFGLISFFIAFADYKKNKYVLIPAFFYFLILIFSLTQEGKMGWYMIPMFPFMAIFSAKLINDGIEKDNWLIFAMLIFVSLFNVDYIFETNFGITALQFRIIMILVFAPFILLQMFGKKAAFSRLSTLWFYFLILCNIYLTYSYIHPA